ncbi:hypothetical protein HDE68_000359 [Pedobacter cryoconitis]|uniref:Lanthionine synthetase-like protein n=1 Tax=Pedobacter cryoconitis TaxID=188932 RepID=A0A7W8ZI47_9SPHI|nr:lanthionine synthetase LanC family protein [Pedobacter cryoconitis]MBB5634474.1 hypothetical protein [Pedobacter cryoconitis]
MKSEILGLLEKINIFLVSKSNESDIAYSTVPLVKEIISSIFKNYIDETEYLKANNTFSNGGMADFYATPLIIGQLQKRNIIDTNYSPPDRYTDEEPEEKLFNKNDDFLFNRAMVLLKERSPGFLNEISVMMNYFGKRDSDLSKRHLLCLTKELKSEFNKHGILATVTHSIETPNILAFGNSFGILSLTLTLIKVQQILELKNYFNPEIEIVIKWIFKFYKEADFGSDTYSVFPQTVDSITQKPFFNNQLFWSQGDTLIAIILYHASDVLDDGNLSRVADLVGLNTLLRKDFNSTQITNSSILNGTSGLAESYKYLYKLSSNTDYLDGYHHWIKETVKMLNNELLTADSKSNHISIYQGIYGTILSLVSFMEHNNSLISIDPLLF